MALVKFSVSTPKCSTCDRWSGPRKHTDDGAKVEVDNAEAGGLCNGGPWDGNVRDPLTRCGRWIMWIIQK